MTDIAGRRRQRKWLNFFLLANYQCLKSFSYLPCAHHYGLVHTLTNDWAKNKREILLKITNYKRNVEFIIFLPSWVYSQSHVRHVCICYSTIIYASKPHIHLAICFLLHFEETELVIVHACYCKVPFLNACYLQPHYLNTGYICTTVRERLAMISALVCWATLQLLHTWS